MTQMLPVSADDRTLTGIENTSVTIFPNPASGIFNIAGWHFANNEQTEITVTDLLGRNVYAGQLNPSNFPIRVNMGNQPDGIYFIHITDSGRQSLQKIAVRN